MDRLEYQKSMCMGCGICHSLYGVKIDRDISGFAIPCVTADNLSEIQKVCPINVYEKETSFSLWGEYKAVYEGWSSDAVIRRNASSGGIITAIAIYLLEKGIVDGVIHISEDEVEHQKTTVRISLSKEEIANNAGSRYSISTPLYDILNIVDPAKKYVFIGKPCDVAALKSAIIENDILRKTIIFTMSFFCAGTPSDTANKNLLNRLGAADKNIVSFRYRGNGWPGFTTAVDSDGNEYSMSYNESWGGILGRDVKRVCRFCLDGIGLYADISCADLWYLDENDNPDFSEHEGRNIIFARSEYGKEVVESALVDKYIEVKDYSDSICKFVKQQPHQFLRRTTMKYRILPPKLFGKCVPKYSKKYLNEAKKCANKGDNRKAFIGSVKRVIRGKV